MLIAKPFPYVCPLCGGGLNECAKRRALLLNENSAATMDMDELIKKDLSVHRTCLGGRTCFEHEICVTSGVYVYSSSDAVYSGYGWTRIGGSHKITMRNGVEFWCRSCFLSSSRNKEKDSYLVMSSEHTQLRKNHLYVVLGLRLGITNDVITHGILPFLFNCDYDSKEFDCLLCNIYSLTDRSYTYAKAKQKARVNNNTEKNQRRSDQKKQKKRKRKNLNHSAN